jgi:hypothetical protein
MKDVLTEPPDHSGHFHRARRKKNWYPGSGVLRFLTYQFELIRHSA